MDWPPLWLVSYVLRVDRRPAPSSTLCESTPSPNSNNSHSWAPLAISSYYAFGIPLGIYLAFKQDMKLPGLWIGLTAALVTTGFIGGLIILWADWDNEVKKVMERLEGERHLGNDDESAECA